MSETKPDILNKSARSFFSESVLALGSSKYLWGPTEGAELVRVVDS